VLMAVVVPLTQNSLNHDPFVLSTKESGLPRPGRSLPSVEMTYKTFAFISVGPCSGRRFIKSSAAFEFLRLCVEKY